MRLFSIAALLFFLSALSVTAQESGSPPTSDDSAVMKRDSSINNIAVEIRDPTAPFLTDRYSYSSLSPLLSQPDDANSIQLDIDFHMNSNAMPTTFAGAFLTQNTITPDMINRVLGYTKKDIKYEDELKAGLAYKRLFKKEITLYVSYYHRNLRSLTTSHDAFQLIFEGNAPFENKTASLNDITFQDLMYNQYSVGVSKSTEHFFFGINASYLQGFTDQQVKNLNGSLYTAPYGETLDIAYNMTFNEATAGASHFFDLNGQGGSADLQFGYRTYTTTFSFTVQDLGVIRWARHPVSYRGDTSFAFSGIEFSNLTNISGSGVQGLNLDSTISVLSPKKYTSAYNTILPATFQLTFSQHLKFKGHDRFKSHEMILSAGVNTRLLYHYYAYGYIKATFLLEHNWTTSVSGGAGGYSLFNLGYDFGKRWRNLDFLLGTNNLIGCIVPMYYPGSSFYLRMVAHF